MAFRNRKARIGEESGLSDEDGQNSSGSDWEGESWEEVERRAMEDLERRLEQLDAAQSASQLENAPSVVSGACSSPSSQSILRSNGYDIVVEQQEQSSSGPHFLASALSWERNSWENVDTDSTTMRSPQSSLVSSFANACQTVRDFQEPWTDTTDNVDDSNSHFLASALSIQDPGKAACNDDVAASPSPLLQASCHPPSGKVVWANLIGTALRRLPAQKIPEDVAIVQGYEQEALADRERLLRILAGPDSEAVLGSLPFEELTAVADDCERAVETLRWVLQRQRAASKASEC